jgi:hypothetical protein
MDCTHTCIMWDMEKGPRENGNEPLGSVTHRQFLD